jgi:hypothetical protein
MNEMDWECGALGEKRFVNMAFMGSLKKVISRKI